MKEYRFITPVYFLMKFGFFTIPVMAASVWGKPWSFVVYGLFYLVYIVYEGTFLIKKVEFLDDVIRLTPIFGETINARYMKEEFEVHMYKGTKFFESKIIAYTDKYKINDMYWNKEMFQKILDELESRL